MGYWRKYMRERITEAIIRLPPNSSKEQIEVAIQNSWPRGEARENFPYKVWLSEKNDFLVAYGIKPPKSKRPSNTDGVVEGQLSLF
jgi:hypothetical protein